MKRFKEYDENKSGILEQDELEYACHAFLEDTEWQAQRAEAAVGGLKPSPQKQAKRPKSRPKSRPRPNLRDVLAPGEVPVGGRPTPHADDFGLLGDSPGPVTTLRQAGYAGRGAGALHQIMSER